MLVQSRLGRVDAHTHGVLSIGKLAAGQEGYYLAAVAHGAEDYYLGAGEVPGYWIGTTADQLGLEGRVATRRSSRSSRACHRRMGPFLAARIVGCRPWI